MTNRSTLYLVQDISNVFFNESTANLTASATFTGATRDVGCFSGTPCPSNNFIGFVFADQATTMRIEMSNDGTTWRRATADQAVAANTPAFLSVRACGHPVLSRGGCQWRNPDRRRTATMINSAFTDA